MRQRGQTRLEPGAGVSISSLAYDYPAGYRIPEHAHASAQLVYATQGVMEVFSLGHVWLVPPQFALWIPAGRPHQIHMPGAVSMRTLYLRPEFLRQKSCAVLHVPPLLRELIVEAVRIGALKRRDRVHEAISQLLISEIGNASSIPTMLAMPKDARVQKLSTLVLGDPRLRLDLLCRKAGISARTAQRIFRREVGTDFETWRLQARLMKAIELMTAGKRIKFVAHAVGYRQASSFVAMFRRHLGQTPGAFVASLTRLPPE